MRFLLALCIACLAPRPADACCYYEPITSASPRSWTVVGPNPRILVTIPSILPQRVTANAPLEQRLVDERGPGLTYELRFHKVEGELTVEVPMAHALTKRL